ncbi:MAG TPA: hypothetical protein DHV07_08520 [Flavobacteriales bacterium]|jgi:gliding motility-associated-like protein|nr:hypothetical protein [Flavobacteriales bacterium]
MGRAGTLLFFLISFVGSHAQFNLVGDAQPLNGGCVQLTAALNAQQGAAWNQDQIDVSLPFCMHLSVNLGSNNGGADGIAFILHQLGPNQATTTSGGNMGYGNYNAPTNTFIDPTFDPSIIIEFDTWQNPNLGDLINDHVALHRDGTNSHNGPECLAGPIEASAISGNIEDGQDHTVHIEWNPSTQSLRMEFDDVERFNATVDLENDVFAGNSMVWWGLTGSTGGASNVQSFCLLDVSNSAGIPELTLSPPAPYSTCPNETITITGSAPGYTVSWQNLNNPVISAGPGEHTIEAQDGGCPLTETISVASLPGPNLSTLTDVTLCDGASTTLTASAEAGSLVDWDGTGNPTLDVSSGGIHAVTAALGTCTESQTVTVVDQASPTIALDTSNDISLCEGDAVTITATTDIVADIQWINTDGTVASSNAELTVEAQASLTVEAQAGGCPGLPEFVLVNMLPLPTATIQSIPNTLCFDETGLVTAVPSPGASVDSWTLPLGTTGVNQAGPGAYTANLIAANGCTNTASYILDALPPIQYELSGPEGACDGSTIALMVSGNFQSAQWSDGTTGNALSLESVDGEGPFAVTVELDGCTATSSAEVQWWPVPSVGLMEDTVIRCVLDPAVEWNWPNQASPAVGWWVWSVNGMTTTGGPVWEAEGAYTVRVLDSMTGCADSTEVYVNVWPNLEVNAAPYAGIVCWDETTEVIAELRGVEGTDIDELPYTLAWDDPEVQGLHPQVGAGIYLLQAENACGQDVAVVEVTQEYCGCDMWMPTAFTPDNDGINDGLKVETNCPELESFQLDIYDRWGQRVWGTDNPDRVWMGQAETPPSEGLHFVPDGVYAYRLVWKYSKTGTPLVEERNGHLHLLR